MKQLVGLLAVFVHFTIGNAQTSERWQQMYGGAGVEIGYGVRSCLDQGYIVVGVSSTSGPTDGYVVRTDSLGLVMWSKFYGGNNIDIIRSIEQLPDSGFILAGYTNSAGHGGYDGWLLRLDKNGDTLWTRHIGSSDWDFFYDVHVTIDGGFLLAGGTFKSGLGDEDMYLVKTDSNGDTVWTRTYGGSRTDEARGVIETEDSLLAICGFTNSFNDTLGDSWLLRLDIDGDTIWTRTLGHLAVEDRAYSIAYDSISNTLYTCGFTNNQGAGDSYWQGTLYNGTLAILIVAAGSQYDEYASIHTVSTLNRVATCGSTFSYGGGLGDMYFFTNAFGWISNTHGTIKEDHAYDFDFAKDGGYIICGSTMGYGVFSENMYLVKSDSMCQSTLVLGLPEVTSSGTTFTSAYPQPAQNTINFSVISSTSEINSLEIEVIDISGRLIETIVSSEFVLQDQHHATAALNVSDYASGMYVYKVLDNSGTLFTDKFIIAR